MRLTYTVTRDDYIQLLCAMIRKNEQRPSQRVIFFLLTVGQMAAVILFCLLQRMSTGVTISLLCWSALIAGINLLRRLTVKSRAKGTLGRLEYSGQLSADYWKRHTLSAKDGMLTLSYGAVKAQAPWSALDPAERMGDTVLVFCGGAIFDLIPGDTFPTEKARAAFIAELTQGAEDSAIQQARQAVEESGGSLVCRFPIDRAAFLRQQVMAYRVFYRRYQLCRPRTFLLLAGSFFMVTNMFLAPSTPNILFSLAVIALLNLRHINAFTPLCFRRVARELRAIPLPGAQPTQAQVYRDDQGLFQTDGRYLLRLDFKDVRSVELTGTHFIAIPGRLPMFVIPLDAFPDLAAARAFGEEIGRESQAHQPPDGGH